MSCTKIVDEIGLQKAREGTIIVIESCFAVYNEKLPLLLLKLTESLVLDIDKHRSRMAMIFFGHMATKI